MSAEYFEITYALLNFENKFIRLNEERSIFNDKKSAEYNGRCITKVEVLLLETEESDTSSKIIEVNHYQHSKLENDVFQIGDN